MAICIAAPVNEGVILMQPGLQIQKIVPILLYISRAGAYTTPLN
jgi:hypothetical protein